jgi:hypothetical protein
MDAERRGSEITSKTGIRVEGTGTILIGLCDVIREMQERIQKLEGLK